MLDALFIIHLFVRILFNHKLNTYFVVSVAANFFVIGLAMIMEYVVHQHAKEWVYTPTYILQEGHFIFILTMQHPSAVRLCIHLYILNFFK